MFVASQEPISSALRAAINSHTQSPATWQEDSQGSSHRHRYDAMGRPVIEDGLVRFPCAPAVAAAASSTSSTLPPSVWTFTETKEATNEVFQSQAALRVTSTGRYGAGMVRVSGVMLHQNGVTESYKGINGNYERSEDMANGRAVYIKTSNPSTAIWWANKAETIAWVVGPKASIGTHDMWAYVHSMGFGPEEASNRPWVVYSYNSNKWEQQTGVQVVDLIAEESISLDIASKSQALRAPSSSAESLDDVSVLDVDEDSEIGHESSASWKPLSPTQSMTSNFSGWREACQTIPDGITSVIEDDLAQLPTALPLAVHEEYMQRPVAPAELTTCSVVGEGHRAGVGASGDKPTHLVGAAMRRVYVREEHETQTDRMTTNDSEVPRVHGVQGDTRAHAEVQTRHQTVQHVPEVDDAQTQMPSRPTTGQIDREWHLVSSDEVSEAVEADTQHIIAETAERLVCGVEQEAAMEFAMAAGDSFGGFKERRVVSAKTQREDPAFVKAREEKRDEVEQREALKDMADVRQLQWTAEKEALKAELARKESELVELRRYLDTLPVVKVTEVVDRTTGKLVNDPTYEYSRIPLEEEIAMHLQQQAERAFQRALEAEVEAEQKRRATAEEAFRFEAAKGEVRLEAFRLEQRVEAARLKADNARDASKVNPRRGAEPDLKEGWVNVKRDGPNGGLQRRMYVLRNTALLSFADESRRGGCLNAIGLESIHRFCKGEGSMLQIHPREGNIIILHCGGLEACNAWLVAFESALKSFRTRYVAQPVLSSLPSPASKSKREVEKDSWDSAIEEKLRCEVEARRNAVSNARMQQARADKMLDDARAEHQKLDRELRLRKRYPDVTGDFLAMLPTPEDRRQIGMGAEGGGGGGGVSMKDMETAIAAAKRKSEEQQQVALQQMQDTWQKKVKESEKKVFELDKELNSYKEMSFKDTGLADLEDMYMGDNVKDQAAADAANFGGTLYDDGMMVVPQDWERLGTSASLHITRPVTSLSDGTVHVFVDGDQAVLIQNDSATLLGMPVEDDDSGRARKEGLI